MIIAQCNFTKVVQFMRSFMQQARHRDRVLACSSITSFMHACLYQILYYRIKMVYGRMDDLEHARGIAQKSSINRRIFFYYTIDLIRESTKLNAYLEFFQ